ncbi:hypothetical protein AVDCRST_MAG81-5156 [uncultured Synechococcales cyanobacterium]|uniref:Uncharacterized protein n=1 Tax=uncultured Synechococcales cyanobacterium TaxID=1936017 RepID=A0A6J4VY41_9CYAN|nr:hypothetical protein AVDCRST_MAG81-5156 [uncultured Synechococcales cyanobacterium]
MLWTFYDAVKTVLAPKIEGRDFYCVTAALNLVRGTQAF